MIIQKMRYKQYKINAIIAVLIIFSMFCADSVFAFDRFDELPKEKKALYLNAGIVSGIALWGTIFWDYGQSSPKMNSELWFSKNSPNGGADKLGHMYNGYVLTHMLSNLYYSWGYETDKATKLGALSSFAVQGIMEIGDAYSSTYGFAYDDFIMNGIGSYLGYLTYRYPEIARKIDLRLEYFPSKDVRSGESLDILTDYNGMKFLVAAKLDGFDFINNKYLKYLELHFGYYTRGYSNESGSYPTKSRNMYFGIGLNISKILREYSMNKTAKVFNYYQVPYTYIPVDYNLDE